MNLPCLLVCCGLTVALQAQTVTVSATLLSPLTVTATVGSQVMTSTQPAGPLQFLGLQPAVYSPLGNAQMIVGAQVTQGIQPQFGIQVSGFSYANGATAASSTGLIDVLLQVQASAPVVANLTVLRELWGTAGAAIPLQRIDVGNDGTFEFTESTVGSSVPGIAIGTQPLPVRVQFQGSTNGTETLGAVFHIYFVAENNLQITPVMNGCNQHYLYAVPSFENTGLTLLSQPQNNQDLSLAVIGLGVAPIVVSAANPSCVLLPSTDLLFVLPAATPLVIPLPASVRPVTFWVQNVVLEQSGAGAWAGALAVGSGYRVDAQ